MKKQHFILSCTLLLTTSMTSPCSRPEDLAAHVAYQEENKMQAQEQALKALTDLGYQPIENNQETGAVKAQEPTKRGLMSWFGLASKSVTVAAIYQGVSGSKWSFQIKIEDPNKKEGDPMRVRTENIQVDQNKKSLQAKIADLLCRQNHQV